MTIEQHGITLRDPKPGDLGWVVHRHGALYASEFGWDWTFEGLVAGIVEDFVKDFKPDRERCWIAERDGDIVGSAFVVQQSRSVAKLRLVYVESMARGLGLGARFVDEALHFARASGYTRMELWTHDVLVAARHIYKTAGFERMSAEPYEAFGGPQVSERWGRDL